MSPCRHAEALPNPHPDCHRHASARPTDVSRTARIRPLGVGIDRNNVRDNAAISSAAVMLIYRSVGASGIAAIMAAYRQPNRTRQTADIRPDPDPCDARSAPIDEHRRSQRGSARIDSDPPSAASGQSREPPHA